MERPGSNLDPHGQQKARSRHLQDRQWQLSCRRQGWPDIQRAERPPQSHDRTQQPGIADAQQDIDQEGLPHTLFIAQLGQEGKGHTEGNDLESDIAQQEMPRQ